jgi:hypothetical protein
MNAPVAPSPDDELCREAPGLSTGILVGDGKAGAGGVAVTTGVGVGVTKRGSGSGATFIGGTEGSGCGDGGITGVGACGLNVGCAGGISLKIDVKLDSEEFGGAGVAGADGLACPNSAVNSPTFFFGGSMDCDDKLGISELSPRNGP